MFKGTPKQLSAYNVDLALKLTPIADDIWLNAMALIAKRKKVMLQNGLILPIPIKGKVKLASTNIGMAANDMQIKEVRSYYKSIDTNLFEQLE